MQNHFIFYRMWLLRVLLEYGYDLDKETLVLLLKHRVLVLFAVHELPQDRAYY